MSYKLIMGGTVEQVTDFRDAFKVVADLFGQIMVCDTEQLITFRKATDVSVVTATVLHDTKHNILTTSGVKNSDLTIKLDKLCKLYNSRKNLYIWK